METIGARIRDRRKALGLSQEEFGRRLGVTQRVVSTWEVGRTQIPADELAAIAATLEADPKELIGSVEPKPLATSNVDGLIDVRRLEAADIPIYAWASLGPIEGEGAAEPVDWKPFPDDVEDLGPRTIGVRVRGRSMANRGIEPGSICYVDPDRTAKGGDTVLARAWSLDGSEAGMVVKALSADGHQLVSDGDDGAEPFPVSRFELIGPVVAVERKYPPRKAREGRRRRSDARDRSSADELLRAFLALPASEQRKFLDGLRLPDAPEPAF